MENISTSKKKAVNMLMETAKQDVRSVTGKNMRNFMVLVGKTSVNAVRKEDALQIKYFPINEANHWKIKTIEEILSVKNHQLEVHDLEMEELDAILNYLCTC